MIRNLRDMKNEAFDLLKKYFWDLWNYFFNWGHNVMVA